MRTSPSTKWGKFSFDWTEKKNVEKRISLEIDFVTTPKLEGNYLKEELNLKRKKTINRVDIILIIKCVYIDKEEAFFLSFKNQDAIVLEEILNFTLQNIFWCMTISW